MADVVSLSPDLRLVALEAWALFFQDVTDGMPDRCGCRCRFGSPCWLAAMVVRTLATIGNPVLRERAEDVPGQLLGSDALRALLSDLFDTMHAYDGIGIAAPQVGESVRVVVIEIPKESPRYAEVAAAPLVTLVNPRVRVLDETEHGYWEGCLSVPDLRGLVWRPRAVQVDYLDPEGEAHTLVAENFLATVMQHEIDHLDGVLFIDKVRDTTKLATSADYERFWLDRPPSSCDMP